MCVYAVGTSQPDEAAERIYASVDYSGPPNRALKPTVPFVTDLVGQDRRQTDALPPQRYIKELDILVWGGRASDGPAA